MGNSKFKSITIAGAPTLTMRYYKAASPQKGIIIFVHGVSHGAWCWELQIANQNGRFGGAERLRCEAERLPLSYF